MPPRVSLILPVHNQADYIAAVVRGYVECLEQLAVSYEIILVPNGSKDRSEAVCENLAKDLGFVRSVAIENAGWGRAVRAGLNVAEGEWICYTNCARTQPQDIQRVVAFALRNPGTVVKVMRKVRHSFLRQVGSHLYSRLCAWLLDLGERDVNGTPKMFPKTFTQLRKLQRDDDLIDLEFLWSCHRDRVTVTELPVYTDSRYGGRSTTGWGTAWRLYSGAVRFWLSVRREKHSQ